jgi:hypothetical protein
MNTPGRIAYIRTLTEPDKPYDQVYRFLEHYIAQKSPTSPPSSPIHHFLFGSSTPFDAHILAIFLSNNIIPSPYPQGIFANLQRSDFSLHMSSARVATGAGRRVLEQCKAGGIAVVISGADDSSCDAHMLRESDYIIDPSIEAHAHWFWHTSRPGIPQDSLLTNPAYDVSRHDASKKRLMKRYAGHGWRANSGCSHGNGAWVCRGCGGKCKRGMCKVNPAEEKEVPEWFRLPEKGSEEWRDLTAEEACWKMGFQSFSGRYAVRDEFRSIDTFSGE